MKSKMYRHIKDDPIPIGYRTCNVSVCKKCGAEALLGIRLPCGHVSIRIRENKTLVKIDGLEVYEND